MRNKLIAIAVASAVLFSQAAFAEWGRGPKEGDFEKHHEAMMKQLNLTPEQEKQLKDYREQQKAEIQKDFEALKAKKDELRKELDKPQVDEAAVRRIADETKVIQNKMVDRRIDSILYMKKVLTPEQFAKFQELAKQKKEQFKEKRFKCKFWGR